MRKPTILLAAIATVLLSGCLTTDPVKVVYQDRLVMPEDALLVDCPIAAPPSKEDYLGIQTTGKSASVVATMPTDADLLNAYALEIKNYENKEKLLAQYAAAQTNNLNLCNIRWKNLRQQKIDLKATLPPKPSGQ